MRKGLLFLFLLAILQHLQAQLFLDTVWLDLQWKQVTQERARYYRLVYADTSGQVQFLVKDFFLDGKLQMTGTYKSINPDVRDGAFEFFYPNGSRQSKLSYVNNKPSGQVLEWYASGIQKSEAWYTNEQLDGAYKTWREDGIPTLSVRYSAGELDGPFVSYYPDGARVREDVYVRGSLRKRQCFTREGKDTSWFPYLELPEFQGGIEKYQVFINENLIYPAEALRKAWQGRVDLEVSISREGTVVKAVILRSDREIFNEEALRLIHASPGWKPGRKDGERIDFTITVPVWFILKKTGNEK